MRNGNIKVPELLPHDRFFFDLSHIPKGEASIASMQARATVSEEVESLVSAITSVKSLCQSLQVNTNFKSFLTVVTYLAQQLKFVPTGCAVPPSALVKLSMKQSTTDRSRNLLDVLETFLFDVYGEAGPLKFIEELLADVKVASEATIKTSRDALMSMIHTIRGERDHLKTLAGCEEGMYTM